MCSTENAKGDTVAAAVLAGCLRAARLLSPSICEFSVGKLHRRPVLLRRGHNARSWSQLKLTLCARLLLHLASRYLVSARLLSTTWQAAGFSVHRDLSASFWFRGTPYCRVNNEILRGSACEWYGSFGTGTLICN